MKTIRFISGLLFLSSIFLISTSFTKTETYSPVFMKKEDLANSIRFIPEGKELINPGKIYYKKPYLFINERYKGVHIYDNSNPASPQNRGFITVPGCLDIAVKGNILYVDNAVDLVAINLDTKQVTQRLTSVFPEPAHPKNSNYRYKDKPEDLVLVEWKINN